MTEGVFAVNYFDSITTEIIESDIDADGVIFLPSDLPFLSIIDQSTIKEQIILRIKR